MYVGNSKRTTRSHNATVCEERKPDLLNNLDMNRTEEAVDHGIFLAEEDAALASRLQSEEQNLVKEPTVMTITEKGSSVHDKNI